MWIYSLEDLRLMQRSVSTALQSVSLSETLGQVEYVEDQLRRKVGPIARRAANMR